MPNNRPPAIAVFFLVGAATAAQSSDRSALARPLALETQVGLGTPLGGLGTAAEWTPVGWFSLSGGGGVTVKDKGGQVQAAFMARVRAGNRESGWAWAAGLGVSGGPYVDKYDRNGGGTLTFLNFDQDNVTITSDFLGWANGEVALERRYASGWQLRWSLGAATMLNPGSVRCNDPGTDCPGGVQERRVIPYLGFSIGYAF